MKENKNKHNQRGQHQNTEKQNTNANKQNTPASSGGMNSGAGTERTREKKPYSHRTGDATNFGDRSYQED
ncbi:MAG TPA: hypothetical protein VGE66_14975 [Chitinophagaceae bacterium]